MSGNERSAYYPPSAQEYLATRPTREQEITTQLANYSGRAVEFVRQVQPESIIGFQRDIQARFRRGVLVYPDQERVAYEVEGIKAGLQHEYSRPLETIDPRALFLITEATDLEGLTLDRLPIDEVAAAIWRKEQVIGAFNHPHMTRMRQLYEGDLRCRFPDGRYDALPQMNSPYLEDNALSTAHAYEEFEAMMGRGKKVGRTLARDLGGFSIVGKHRVGMPFGSETMPHVVGSPDALASIVQCHGQATAPRDNIFSDPYEQAALLNQTIDLLENSPVKQGREDADVMMDQWTRNLGILVEPDPYKAVERISIIMNELAKRGRSIGYVRIYSVEGSDEILETLDVIKRYFPGLDVIVGQLVDADQAMEAQERGADGGQIGITSGTQCSTALRTGVGGQNINQLFLLRQRGIRIPIMGESGIPHAALPVALAAGLSKVNYSAGILGWLDAVGGMYGLRDQAGNMFHVYNGEAGPDSKQHARRLYAWGQYINLEGKNGLNAYNPNFATIAEQMWYLHETVALTESFHRHVMLEDMHHDQEIVIRNISPQLAGMRPPHQIR